MNNSSRDINHDSSEQVIDFILPDIGEGIVECEVVEWQVKEGDYVKEDQRVADVSTDKALVEITSMHTGRIVMLHYQQGEIAKVHTPMFAIAVNADQIPDRPELVSTPELSTAGTVINASEKKILTTPAVRRLARENNLDLSLVTSTGKNGRVLKEDALNFLKNRENQTSVSSLTSAPLHNQKRRQEPGDRVEPIKGVQAIMAKTMMESVSSIPHFTYVDEVDMGSLMALRSQLKEHYEKQGVRLTMMPFFMKALSLAIKQYPILNSTINTDLSELRFVASHNIGMAVDSTAGLLVPNIKGVQNLSIIDIAEQTQRLTEAARSGRISPDDMKSGTITISNVGAIGGIAATPIINKPEVAIVALGKVQTLPRFDSSGNVTAKHIMAVSWSGDHRVIDGATMARFNNAWKEYLENPSSMLMVMS